jgi:plasmid stabilization system protein ParE
MALTIVWSIRAANKFEQIISYLDVEWGEMAARKFVRKVDDFLDILGAFPDVGKLENPGKNIRGFVIVPQVSLYYKIKDNQIILLNFHDNRQASSKAKY